MCVTSRHTENTKSVSLKEPRCGPCSNPTTVVLPEQKQRDSKEEVLVGVGFVLCGWKKGPKADTLFDPQPKH